MIVLIKRTPGIVANKNNKGLDHLCPVFLMHCCLVVTYWERAVLLALVSDVYCIFVNFLCGFLGQVWYLIVSFPDLCRLSY